MPPFGSLFSIQFKALASHSTGDQTMNGINKTGKSALCGALLLSALTVAGSAQAGSQGRKNTAAVLGALTVSQIMRGNTNNAILAGVGTLAAYGSYKEAKDREDRYDRYDRYDSRRDRDWRDRDRRREEERRRDLEQRRREEERRRIELRRQEEERHRRELERLRRDRRDDRRDRWDDHYRH
jgi:hypothetical protein